MSKKYILALDQGTTSSRAILFDKAGAVRAVAQREFTQIFPKPGWVEHNPMEIWETQRAVADEVLAKVDPKEVAAIGITNQRETALIWERKTGKPIANAIVWQDRRTAQACDKLRAAKWERRIAKKTGLVIDAYFSATKVQWLLQNTRGAQEKARRGELAFGTVDSWLIWQLTGGALHVTDPSNASRTMLYNIHTGEWDEELLDLFDIPESLLPDVRPSSEVLGSTTIFAEAIPIAGVAGDQQAALFGQACHSPGMVKNTYGTGCFMLMNVGAKPVLSRNKLLTTIAWRIGNKTEYALEGSIFIAGALVQWLRDGLGIIRSSAEVEELARQVEDNGGVYVVPALAGLGAPHWDAYARGLIGGLVRGTRRGHIARASLEAIAFQVADVLRAMEADAGVRLKELRVDGGASKNDLLMQFQSDILGVPVLRPVISETTALGAAFLAGLAVGFWGSTREIQSQWQVEKKFLPSMKKETRKSLFAGWDKAVKRAKKWEDAASS